MTRPQSLDSTNLCDKTLENGKQVCHLQRPLRAQREHFLSPSCRKFSASLVTARHSGPRAMALEAVLALCKCQVRCRVHGSNALLRRNIACQRHTTRNPAVCSHAIYLYAIDVSATLPSAVPDPQSSRSDQKPVAVPPQDTDRGVIGKAPGLSSSAGIDSRVSESTNSHPPVAAKRGSLTGAANPTCPRCSKNVYFAEMMQGPGGSKYHKLCFRCSDCDKSLDSMNSCVTTENVLLCKTCYSKKHGPVGFG